MGDDVMLRKYRIDNEQQQVPPPASVQNQLVQIDTTGMMEIPLERYALFGSGRLEIADNVSAIVQVNFSEDETNTQLGDNYLGSFWGAYVPHGTGIYAPSVGAGGATLPAYLPGGAYGLNCAPTGGCTNSQVWPTSQAMSQLLDSRTNANVAVVDGELHGLRGQAHDGQRRADVSVPRRDSRASSKAGI